MSKQEIMSAAETAPVGRYGWLAVALTVLALMYPMLGHGPAGHIVWTAVFWLVLFACLRATVSLPGTRVLVRLLGWVAIAASFASLWCFGLQDDGHGAAYATIHGLSLVFLAFTTVAILVDVFRHSRVTWQTLLGAACGYVLLGMTFAFALLALHGLGFELLSMQGAISRPLSGPDLPAIYLYFSFVTLSTLGYGDIVPVSPVAQMLAPVEAIIGQLFLAVFIGRLIGMHVSRARSS